VVAAPAVITGIEKRNHKIPRTKTSVILFIKFQNRFSGLNNSFIALFLPVTFAVTTHM
jgi:hypothetical protein